MGHGETGPAGEQDVARLRQRIFTATRDGNWPKVRNLQKMMLRSWSNTLVSVRQVTQRRGEVVDLGPLSWDSLV